MNLDKQGKIASAEEQIIATHNIHTTLLVSDIFNKDINILVVHAEDHLN